jgi:hypothetical protein
MISQLRRPTLQCLRETERLHVAMSRHFLDAPRLLIHKTVLGIIQPETPGLGLLLTMAYFGIVYFLFYVYGVTHPLLAFSLNLRPLFGFDGVHSAVGLFECVTISSQITCPAGTSNYYSAVMASYLSAFTPKLSVTYSLVALTFADLLLARLRGPFALLKTRLQVS